MTVKSPCTGVCRLDPQNVCVGCGRDIEEIIAWADLPEAAQHEIVQAARERLRKLSAHDAAEKD